MSEEERQSKDCGCDSHIVRVRYEILLALCSLIAASVYQFAELELKLYNERAYSRQICVELARLTREIGKIPANDCARP
jgi:hypothetical protein